MSPFEKLREEAVRLIRKADYSSARDIAGQLIRDYPKEAETWNTRAYLNASCGDFRTAIADMSEAITITMDEPGYFFTRGRYFFTTRNYLEAIKDFTSTLKLSASLGSEYYQSTALFFRADAYVRLGCHREAKLDCDQVPIDFQTWTDQLRTRQEILKECNQAGI